MSQKSDLRPNSEIADGVHWLKDKFVNNYIVQNGDELVLVDAAANRKAAGILKYIRAELESRKVSTVLVTHHHMDHRGGLRALQDHFHPRIFAHELDVSVISGEKKPPLPNSKLLKPLFFVLRPFMTPKPISGVELVSDGELVDGLHVHHLPGHTMGSLAFQKDRTVFCGDVAATRQGRPTLAPKIFAESLKVAENSFGRLGDLDFDQILPGHGGILDRCDGLLFTAPALYYWARHII